MKAMIFAAGLGTRLFPITQDKPKALAPFKGTTLLEYNLRFLASQGVTEFVINTHHFANKIEEYLIENNNFGLKIQLSFEPILLDTAGGLAQTASFFDENEDLLLYNVDVISNIDIQAMYQKHQSSNAAATLAIRNRKTSRYLLFNKENTLCGWRNKITNMEIWSRSKKGIISEFAFSGIHFINMSLIKSLEIKNLSIVPFYLTEAKKQRIMGYQHDSDYWFDCGKIESLKEAEKFI